jgi:hypothetical protein
MIDEIGKGTSSRDGSSLAGALLEALDQRGLCLLFVESLFLFCFKVFTGFFRPTCMNSILCRSRRPQVFSSLF